MTSRTTEREPDHLPGAFPVTPGEHESGLFSSGAHHNKLHKREDPRGWSTEAKASHGHQHTDSGIGLADTNSPVDSRARDSTMSGGAYDLNKAGVAQNRSSMANTAAAPTTSGTGACHGGETKPGMMTGAHSRMEHGNNNSYPQSTMHDPTKLNNTNAAGVGAGNAAGMAPAVPSSNTVGNDTNKSSNIVRNGLRQSTDLDHKDPYWGDVPYGTGVYNGVTGHGSSENTSSPQSSGIYNGVTGRGSSETPTVGSSHAQSHPASYDQQRAIPPSTSDTAARGETSPHNSSRFREGATGAGVGAGAGLAASELAGKQHERSHRDDTKSTTTPRKHETAEPRRESRLAGLFHRDHKYDDTKPEKHHEPKEKKIAERGPAKDDKPLTNRDAGAALAAASTAYGAKDHADKHDKKHHRAGSQDANAGAFYQHPDEKVANRPATGTTSQPQLANNSDPFISAGYTGLINQDGTPPTGNTRPAADDMTPRGPPFGSHTADKPAHHDNSGLGYGLAAAGAGAGAGYAAHKHGNRADDGYKGAGAESGFNSRPTASPTGLQHLHTGYTIGQPQLGVGSGHMGDVHLLERQAALQTSSRTGATQNDKYNTLSNGTPSGIDIGNHHSDKNVVPTSTTSGAAPNSSAPRDNHTGAKATAAGVGAAGAGAAAAHYASQRDGGKTTTPEKRQPAVSGSREAREPHMASATSRDSTTAAHAGQYKTLPTGTPSGVSLDDGSRRETPAGAASTSPTTARDSTNTSTHDHRGAKAAAAAGTAGAGAAAVAGHQRQRSGDTSSGSAAATDSAARQPAATKASPPTGYRSAGSSPRTSTDSSHGGLYNVLSSGTPSGINVNAHKQQHERGDARTSPVSAAQNYSNNNTASSPTAAASAPARTQQQQQPSSAASKIPKPAAAAAATAAAAPSLAAGDRVFHRCRKCGEDNDITGYFQDKKQ
ncbi:hypothetical protein GGR52DRAFT_591869 [Hypoxylon sp. FL1284]|nr:hypothetical protein GGR52DRAFT_591869 [Hypoxylon sp. FL1284]